MSIQARYSGTCPECGGRWQPGDFIRAEAPPLGSLPEWKHAICPDAPDDLTVRHGICQTCRLDHPEGACDR